MDDKELLTLWKTQAANAPFALEKVYGETVNTVFSVMLRSKAEIGECRASFFEETVQTPPPKKAKYLKTELCRRAKCLAKKKQDINSVKNRDTLYSLCMNELREVCWTQTGEAKRKNEELDALKNTVERFLKKCSRKNRLLFLRRYWFCDTISDLSLHFNKSERSIRNRLAKSRRRLEKLLMKNTGAVTLEELSEALLYINHRYIRASFY